MPYPTAQIPEPLAEATTAMLLRLNLVMGMTGLGRSTIYRLMAENQFPRPVRITKRAVAWRRADVERWTAGRPAVVH